MGKYTRAGSLGHQIQCFTPDNDDKTLYIEANYSTISLEELLKQIQKHFGECSHIDQFEIGAEHIQTDCIGYDRYDAGDYTNYLVIKKIE